jgi:hypothetical protein
MTHQHQFEGNLDLGNAFRCRWNANEIEIAKLFVVADELSFTLINVEFDSSLSIGRSRENLVGIVVLRLISLVIIPPRVSIPEYLLVLRATPKQIKKASTTYRETKA